MRGYEQKECRCVCWWRGHLAVQMMIIKCESCLSTLYELCVCIMLITLSIEKGQTACSKEKMTRVSNSNFYFASAAQLDEDILKMQSMHFSIAFIPVNSIRIRSKITYKSRQI